MLVALSIRDIVLIDRLSIDFTSGMTVLTGETGAGKSILLDSLSLALGGRGDSGLVRAGAEQAKGDPDALAALIGLFVRGILSTVLSGANFRWQIPIMLREFQDPSEEFPMLVRERIDPMHDALCAVVGGATGKSAEAPETRLLTANIIGQCMMFGAARGVVFTRLDWEEYTPERIELIIETMVPRIQAMLGLRPAPGAAEGRSE